MLKKKKQNPVNDTADNLQDTNGHPDTEIQGTEQAPVTEDPTIQLMKDLEEANDKYLRLYAEFDNFKRRTSRERMDLLQTAGKDVIISLLPVLDDFERAVKSMETASDVASVKAGVELVHHKLKNILSQKGLKEMESKGQTFDSELHEAITNVPMGEEQKGKVVDEVEKGYFLNEKVIRFAKVVVGA